MFRISTVSRSLFYDPSKSIENNAVTGSYSPRGGDHGVHTSARVATQIADLDLVVMNQRPKNVGVLG